MNENALIDKLLHGQFYPPIYPRFFEYGDYGIKEISEQFISNVLGIERELTATMTGNNLRLRDWLLKLLENTNVPSAFFGRSVYGEPGCGTRDIEAMAFIPGKAGLESEIIWKKPSHVTLLKIFEDKNSVWIGDDFFRDFVSGPVLVFGSNQSAISWIENARNGMMEDMDAESFVFSLLPHAAAKIVNQQELDHFEKKEHQAYFAGKALSSRQDLFMDLGQQPTIGMTNQCYMRQMGCMDEPELTALAKAALKRIRVKQEHREMLAHRFAQKMKKAFKLAI